MVTDGDQGGGLLAHRFTEDIKSFVVNVRIETKSAVITGQPARPDGRTCSSVASSQTRVERSEELGLGLAGGPLVECAGVPEAVAGIEQHDAQLLLLQRRHLDPGGDLRPLLRREGGLEAGRLGVPQAAHPRQLVEVHAELPAQPAVLGEEPLRDVGCGLPRTMPDDRYR
jgi:hypothetical protein